MTPSEPPHYTGTKGMLSYSHSEELENTHETTVCGGEIVGSDQRAWEQGINGGFSLYGVSVTVGITHNSSVTLSNTWGGDANRATKIEIYKPMRIATYQISHRKFTVNVPLFCSNSSGWPADTGDTTVSWCYQTAQVNTYEHCCEN